MALATHTHHSAQRQKKARWEESELNNAVGQKTPPPRAASTVYFMGCPCRPADTSRRGAATAAGSAAHRGADCRDLRTCSGSRCSGAADGESGGGGAVEDRHGYRCAQALSGPNPAAFCKCLRSCPSLLCSGLRSRTLTFQFRVVEAVVFADCEQDR